MKIWIALKTRLASLQRAKVLMEGKKIDIVALMREILSPRKDVYKKTPWLCFEAEMKVQIWPSQLETYNNLM